MFLLFSETIKHVPYQVRDCMERKLFLKCSDILIDARK